MESVTEVYEVYVMRQLSYSSVGLFDSEIKAKAVTIELNETEFKETFECDDWGLINGATYVKREVY